MTLGARTDFSGTLTNAGGLRADAYLTVAKLFTVAPGGTATLADRAWFGPARVDGRLEATPGGGHGISASSLTIGPGGTLDLADNGLVLRTDAATQPAALAALAGHLRSGRNGGAGGPWTGAGLTSSSAAAQAVPGLTTLALIPNRTASGAPRVTSFAGWTSLSADAVLVHYTLAGDVTLDGAVGADDYLASDTGFLAQARGGGRVGDYHRGDFNYDGVIDAADYHLIDRSAALGAAAIVAPPAPPAAVPEPAGAVLGLLAAGRLLRRRPGPSCPNP